MTSLREEMDVISTKKDEEKNDAIRPKHGGWKMNLVLQRA